MCMRSTIVSSGATRGNCAGHGPAARRRPGVPRAPAQGPPTPSCHRPPRYWSRRPPPRAARSPVPPAPGLPVRAGRGPRACTRPGPPPEGQPEKRPDAPSKCPRATPCTCPRKGAAVLCAPACLLGVSWASRQWCALGPVAKQGPTSRTPGRRPFAGRMSFSMAPETGTTQPAAPNAAGTDMLATFLSLMPDAAVVVDGNGVIVSLNEQAEALFGYDAASLEGRSIESLVPERFRHSHRRQRSNYVDAPQARPMGAGLDLYARRRDGSEFPVDISLAPIGGDGQPLVVAAVRDISERKAAQAAQAQLAAIVQSTADGILSMSQSGVITSWNPGAEKMFGFRPEEVVGRHVGLLFPDDPVLGEMLDAARSGHVHALEGHPLADQRRARHRRRCFRVAARGREGTRLFCPGTGHHGTQGGRSPAAPPGALAGGNGRDPPEPPLRGAPGELAEPVVPLGGRVHQRQRDGGPAGRQRRRPCSGAAPANGSGSCLSAR